MSSSSIYKSTDVSAPALIATTGGLITLLDAVLVNGYGALSSLGWTKEYQSGDNLQAVYRNAGTGRFLRVNNSVNFDGTYSSAKIEVFEVMRSWDVGYTRCPEDAANQYIGYADTQDAARAIPWWIIGDSKGFWFCAEYDTATANVMVVYLGDYIPYHLQNESNWINFASTNDGGSGDQFKAFTATTENQHIRIGRDYDNALPVQLVNFYRGCGAGSSDTLLGTSVVTCPFPTLAKPLLGLDGELIGEVPGLYEAIGGVEDRDIIEAANGGQIYIFTTYGSGRIGLMVGEDFRND